MKSLTKNLDKAIGDINKKYGSGSVMTFDSENIIKTEVVPSGSLGIDLALGIGGWPRGRIVELMGWESSGKTTIAMHAMVEAQKLGLRVAIVDAEHAFDPSYAESLGMNINDLLISQPSSGEQALEIAEELISTGDIGVLVVDSVAALVPQAELNGEMGDSNMGNHARLMSQAMRKMVAIVNQSKTTVFFINQLREKIGVMFGNPETTTGGNALKFYASVRVKVSRTAKPNADSEGDAISNRVKIQVIKNKCAPPFKKAEFDIMYGTGISRIGEIFDIAVEKGVIEKMGSWYSYNDSKIGQGKDAAIACMKDNPDMTDEIESVVVAGIAGTNIDKKSKK